MKVIFLDIDGVINSERLFQKHYKQLHDGAVFEPYQNYSIDKDTVEMLFNYIERYNLYIVISSWREITLKQTLCVFMESWLAPLVPRIIGQTPHMYNSGRGTEIDYWLKDRPEINDYAIIDDDDFDIHQKDHLVKTDFMNGLTQQDLDKCTKILKL